MVYVYLSSWFCWFFNGGRINYLCEVRCNGMLYVVFFKVKRVYREVK